MIGNKTSTNKWHTHGYLSLLLWLVSLAFGYAQELTVSGTVSDEQGIPLAGANVLIKGTTTGTQTDFDGNYTITAESDAVLVFSYIGFTKSEVAVNSQSTLNVTLSEDASQLEEVW